MNPARFVHRGGLWVAAQAVLLLAVIASGLTWRHQWDSAATDVLGWLFLTVSILCGIGGAVALGRHLTPFPQPTKPSRLVRHGIYSFIRHPLYTSLICGCIGWALVRASWPALGTVLAMAVFLDGKARREERWLRGQFPEYADYARRVRRFVPWIY